MSLTTSFSTWHNTTRNPIRLVWAGSMWEASNRSWVQVSYAPMQLQCALVEARILRALKFYVGTTYNVVEYLVMKAHWLSISSAAVLALSAAQAIAEEGLELAKKSC